MLAILLFIFVVKGCASGVIRTRVGFSGGAKPNPTYRSLGDHTETTEVVYDPTKTNYSNLLNMFWKNHDSTQKCTRQYMSAVFYHNEEQKRLAIDSLEQAQKVIARPIQTQILKASTFYEAEDYHQKYLLQQHPWLMNALDISPGPELNNSNIATRLNGYIGGYGTLANFEAELPNLHLDDKMADYIRRAMQKGSRVNC
ncbi:peptide methionine sulfoxide reductase-like isoform X1 [Daphnia pulex]|uniref:peptide methionine sulfoxide reductase-like isoform X1 n=1 Tax=Daphnia pulex TaxID=6669 RepID=UPI001EDE6F5C|nr:peptide methionine sulfoxide reductase-like isoform X1 [Daphnia pulex]